MRPFPEGGRIKCHTWFFFFLGGDFEFYMISRFLKVPQGSLPQRCPKGAPKVTQRCPKGAQKVPKRCPKGAPRVPQRCLIGAPKVQQRCLKGAPRVPERCL